MVCIVLAAGGSTLTVRWAWQLSANQASVSAQTGLRLLSSRLFSFQTGFLAGSALLSIILCLLEFLNCLVKLAFVGRQTSRLDLLHVNAWFVARVSLRPP